jgi:hypothetical protein
MSVPQYHQVDGAELMTKSRIIPVLFAVSIALFGVLTGCGQLSLTRSSASREHAAMRALSALARIDKINVRDPEMSVDRYESVLNEVRKVVREAEAPIGDQDITAAFEATLDRYVDMVEVWREALKHNEFKPGTDLAVKLEQKYSIKIEGNEQDTWHTLQIENALGVISDKANERLEEAARMVAIKNVASNPYQIRYLAAPSPEPESPPRSVEYNDVLRFENRGVLISVIGYIDPVNPDNQVRYDKQYLQARLCAQTKPRCNVYNRTLNEDGGYTESSPDDPKLYIPMKLIEPFPQKISRAEDIRYQTAEGKAGNNHNLVRVTGVVKSRNYFYVREISIQ